MRRLVLFSILGTLFLSGSGMVQASNCAGITNDGERLSCFDAGRSCAGISEAATRLTCFDELYDDAGKATATSGKSSAIESTNIETSVVGSTASVNNVTEHSGTESTVSSKKVVSEPLAQNTAPVEGDNEANFGKKKEFTDPSDYIKAKIVEVKRNSQRIDYIRLDNGHVWREYQDYRIRYKVGQTVVIEEGVLGSFNMKIEGVTKLIKVKRLK